MTEVQRRAFDDWKERLPKNSPYRRIHAYQVETLLRGHARSMVKAIEMLGPRAVVEELGYSFEHTEEAADLDYSDHDEWCATVLRLKAARKSLAKWESELGRQHPTIKMLKERIHELELVDCRTEHDQVIVTLDPHPDGQMETAMSTDAGDILAAECHAAADLLAPRDARTGTIDALGADIRRRLNTRARRAELRERLVDATGRFHFIYFSGEAESFIFDLSLKSASWTPSQLGSVRYPRNEVVHPATSPDGAQYGGVVTGLPLVRTVDVTNGVVEVDLAVQLSMPPEVAEWITRYVPAARYNQTKKAPGGWRIVQWVMTLYEELPDVLRWLSRNSAIHWKVKTATLGVNNNYFILPYFRGHKAEFDRRWLPTADEAELRIED